MSRLGPTICNRREALASQKALLLRLAAFLNCITIVAPLVALLFYREEEIRDHAEFDTVTLGGAKTLGYGDCGKLMPGAYAWYASTFAVFDLSCV